MTSAIRVIDRIVDQSDFTGSSVVGLPASCVITRGNGTATRYVSAANTSAARGTALLAAVAAWQAGETLSLQAGTFDIGNNRIVLQSGSARLIGAGMNLTVIQSSVASSTGPIVQATTDSEIADLTIHGTLANDFQLPWGVNSNVGTPPAFTNAVVRNVKLIGDTDGVFVSHGSACTARLYNVVIQAKYDCTNISSPGGLLEFYNLRCINTGDSYTGSPPRGFACSTDGTVEIFVGYIQTTANTGSTVSGVETAGATVNLHAVKIATTNAAGQTADLQALGGAINVDPACDFSTTGTNGGAINRLGGRSYASALGTTPADGFVVENVSDAANGAPQMSPRVRWSGRGWKSGIGSASRVVDFAADVLPIQASGNPNAQFLLKSQVNGAGYSNRLGVDNNGIPEFFGDTRVSTQFDKANATLANVTGLSATLIAGNTYEFVACLHVTPDATGGHKYAIAGTATATAVVYQINSINNATNAYVINSRQTALAGSAGQAGPTAIYTEIRGIITVNAAGTLTVQFAQNATSGTSSVLVGSTFKVRQIN